MRSKNKSRRFFSTVNECLTTTFSILLYFSSLRHFDTKKVAGMDGRYLFIEGVVAITSVSEKEDNSCPLLPAICISTNHSITYYLR